MIRRATLASLTVLAAACAFAAPALADPPDGAGNSAFGLSNKPVCGDAPLGYAHCNSRVVTDATGKPDARPQQQSGLTPADLQAAYGVQDASPSPGTGPTIAIVDAYDDPTAASDLNTYRTKFGLGQCGSGCFTKIDQRGGTAYPRSDGGWAQEISLDLDMASAICPDCKILLVEADSNSFTNLTAAVNRAASWPGVVAISNSYGGSEFSSETSSTYDGPYNHPGIAVTVSSGDSGYGVEFPAASEYVTAVGGTSLSKSGGAWTEKAWSGAGSGCSAYVPKPSWQSDTGCANRTVADVSADADPNTGVAVYDSTSYQGRYGWMVFGGTSVAAPIIGGVYARANNTNAITYGSYPYSHTGGLFDVTSGSNGSCGGSYLCTAGSGFDGPTGLGSPRGTGAF